MKVKCINQGNFKNLTLEKEYAVWDEIETKYQIASDDNELRLYGKRYFEEVIEEVIEPVIEKKEAVIEVQLENEDDYDYDEGISCYVNGQYLVTFALSSSIAGNCGVIAVDGISYLMTQLVAHRTNGLFEECVDDIFENILKRVIEILADDSWGLILFSTNTKDMALITLMDEMADYSTDEFKNPNSGNMCKMWHFFINQ